jgi:hypothetical protein
VLNPLLTGDDVFRQVAEVANQVILSARSWKDPECAADAANPRPFGPRGNVTRRGMVSALHPDGRVEFAQVRVAVVHTSSATLLHSPCCSCADGTSLDG